MFILDFWKCISDISIISEAFLLVTITFMISEINIDTRKNWIIDIKNDHCY